MVDYKKLFAAIEEIHTQAAIAKKDEPDDFDYSIISDIDQTAQKGLWFLTRGKAGTKTHLDLKIF